MKLKFLAATLFVGFFLSACGGSSDSGSGSGSGTNSGVQLPERVEIIP